MKTHNLNLNALILILVLTLTGQSYAHNYSSIADEKKVVKINMKAPLIKFITSTLDISSADLEDLKQHLNDASLFIFNNDSIEMEITLIDSKNAESFLIIDYVHESTPLEAWMFEDDYLNTEAEPVIEDWMFEDD